MHDRGKCKYVTLSFNLIICPENLGEVSDLSKIHFVIIIMLSCYFVSFVFLQSRERKTEIIRQCHCQRSNSKTREADAVEKHCIVSNWCGIWWGRKNLRFSAKKSEIVAKNCHMCSYNAEF